MDPQSNLSRQLRKTLLLKVISNKEPKPEDIDSVLEFTSEQIVELLMAQSITFYLVQGNEIHFKHIYYSPTLYSGDADREKEFALRREKLLQLKLPMDTGIVGKVIQRGEPAFFSLSRENSRPMFNMFKDTGFEVTSMLTVPLIGSRCIGAVQLLNREPDAPHREFRHADLKALEEVAEYTAPLVQRLIDPNYQMPGEMTAKYIARFTNCPLITTTEEVQIDDKLLELVGDAIIRRTGIFPLKQLHPGALSVLMVNPYDYQNRENFQSATELRIEEASVAPATLIDQLLRSHFKSDQATLVPDSQAITEIADIIGEEYAAASDEAKASLDSEESAPIITLANRIIEDAYVAGASDIHIEPQENDLLVRYRVDGVCQEKLRLPRAVAAALVARLKVMSNLDIAEKRIPQDGRIVFKHFTRRKVDIDLRVATAPMNFGEKVVMRILDKTKSALPITALGFSQENLGIYRECIRQPYGMILHCGPTGSGKSMTLFSALREIADPTINIQTAEDPIEYTIPGINQMQVHRQIGLDFARALRAYLRMDPDVILVGEIRDKETAEIAVEAALTGHLLLSTLHTNDAPSTIARFTDMEIEPFMISSSMLIVCAQRLMRRVCKTCRIHYTPEGKELEIIQNALPGWAASPVYKASETGCQVCGGKGYKGRIGIHELMRNNDELTRAINREADTAELKRIAMHHGMKSLHQDSILKLTEEVSTLIEALATVPPDMTGIAAEKPD